MTQETVYKARDIIDGKINFIGITHQYIFVKKIVKSDKDLELFGQALNILAKAGWTVRHFYKTYAVLERPPTKTTI